jgi:hypothetical protein
MNESPTKRRLKSTSREHWSALGHSPRNSPRNQSNIGGYYNEKKYQDAHIQLPSELTDWISTKAQNRVAFKQALDERIASHLSPYSSRWEKRRTYETFEKLDYNPNYVSKSSGLSIVDPRLQAFDLVDGYYKYIADLLNRSTQSATPPVEPSSQSGCVKQTSAKYTSPSRKSPPYPANQCQAQTMVGNDGQMYKSTPNVKNVYTWKKITNK